MKNSKNELLPKSIPQLQALYSPANKWRISLAGYLVATNATGLLIAILFWTREGFLGLLFLFAIISPTILALSIPVLWYWDRRQHKTVRRAELGDKDDSDWKV